LSSLHSISLLHYIDRISNSCIILEYKLVINLPGNQNQAAMQKHAIIITFILLTIILSCSTQTKHPLSCNENAGADKLLVFIGEKISIKGMNDEKDIMDAKFLATYKIREIVCGSYEKENIDFIV